MRKASVAEDAGADPHAVDEHEVPWMVNLILSGQKRLNDWFRSSPDKTVEELKMEEMASIIKTYRGIDDEEIADEHKVWVDRAGFDLFISAIIVINTIIVGLETDASEHEANRAVVWLVLEILFCIVFLTEVILKVYYHGTIWMYSEVWNVLTTAVAFWTFASLIVACLAFGEVFTDKGIHSKLRMISLIRVVGLVRLVKIIQRHKSLDELRLVLQGIMDSFQTLIWVVLLSTCFLYVCAVLMTKQVGHNVEIYGEYRKLSGGWDHEAYFGTMGRSMYTLLQCMTRNGWSSKIARHVIANQWYMNMFFMFFLLLSTYGLLNLVVSVIVEHTIAASKNAENRQKVANARNRRAELESIREIFMLADVDSSGILEIHEFLEACMNPEVMLRLRQMEIPINDAAALFSIIDGDGSRSLSVEEFINGCTKLKGMAQSKDILAVQAQADTLARKMDVLIENLGESERMMAALDEVSKRVSRRFKPAVLGSRRKIARRVGGVEPVVPPPREKSSEMHGDLGVGNVPMLPLFPSLLH